MQVHADKADHIRSISIPHYHLASYIPPKSSHQLFPPFADMNQSSSAIRVTTPIQKAEPKASKGFPIPPDGGDGITYRK